VVLGGAPTNFGPEKPEKELELFISPVNILTLRSGRAMDSTQEKEAKKWINEVFQMKLLVIWSAHM
jgi:hypothetical protein